MSGSCKVGIGFRASELVFLAFLHSHVGKATYPRLASLSGGFSVNAEKVDLGGVGLQFVSCSDLNTPSLILQD